MFGFRKKQQPQASDEQIPYEIYETIHQPAARRRRLIIRLILALLIATLIIIGVIAWRNRNDTNKPAPSRGSGESSQQQPASGAAQQNPVGQPSRQAPQSNAPIPKPEVQQPSTPAGGDLNTGTVNRPE